MTGPAVDVLHGNEAESVGNAEIEDADHVPMRDFACENQFLLKSLKNARMAGQVSPHHLYGHQPVQLSVSCLVDRAHAPFPQHLQDFVTIRDDTSNVEGDT